MATYREIHGKAVKSVSTDPSAETDAGQIWYNTTSNTFKSIVSLSAWSSSSIMPISKYAAQGGGTQTAAFVAGGGPGSSPPFPGNASVTTVEYNGTGWSSGGDLGMARYAGAAAGTLTAGILAAGYNQQSPYGRNLTETYDGSSWTEVGDLSTAGYNTGSAIGTETATVVGNGIQFSGGPSATLLPSGTVEEFDGSSWTGGGDRGTAVIAGVNYGTLTAGVSATGGTAVPGTPKTTAVKNYDGTSWTAAPAINTARRELGGGGVQTAAIIFGGDPDPGSSTTATETFDGTSWATSPATIGTAIVSMGFSSNSTSTAAFSGGGSNPGPVTNVTEEWNVSTNVITAAAWASGGALPSASMRGAAGAGTQTAGLIAGGYTTGTPGATTEAYLYDGSTWTATGDVPAAREGSAGCGTQTAAFAIGGKVPGDAAKAETYIFGGSSWTAAPSLPTATGAMAAFGTTSAAAAAGGSSTFGPANAVNASYEYNGSSWTAGENMNTARNNLTGFGTQTAGAVNNGYIPGGSGYSAATEEYDGTDWTTGNAMLVASSGCRASGASQTDAILFSGRSAANNGEQRTFGYDGTTWSSRPSLANNHYQSGGAGTSSTTTFLAGGGPKGSGTPDNVTNTEQYTPESTAVNVKTLTQS